LKHSKNSATYGIYCLQTASKPKARTACPKVVVIKGYALTVLESTCGSIQALGGAGEGGVPSGETA
jgi:hypothetical protein